MNADQWELVLDPVTSQRMDIKIVAGDSEVFKVIACIGGTYKSVSILGLLDGDAKAKTPKAIRAKALYLPGEVPVEAMFRTMLESQLDIFGKKIDRPNLAQMMFPFEGINYHDWFKELVKITGYSKSQTFLLLFNQWIEIDKNLILCKDTVDSSRRFLGLED